MSKPEDIITVYNTTIIVIIIVIISNRYEGGGGFCMNWGHLSVCDYGALST
jgi:hypothetical protein